VTILYTNGWLVDEALLDKLEARHMHPNFQLSYDGIGMHDFLRGIDGAEEKTIHALKLLQERNYKVSVSMCIHRKNRDTVRETIRLLGSLGVQSVKLGSMMEAGEWCDPEVKDLHLTRQEELELFEQYIPQYFEDDAPVSIMMADTLMYTPGDPEWKIHAVRRIAPEEEDLALSCSVLKNFFYIGADGMVAPCMGMCDCGFASHFPNVLNTPLKEILRDSELTELCSATVKSVRDHNPRCRACAYVDRCTGGCRNSVLLQGDDYYGIDENLCYFFENGWEERIRKAAELPFREYLKRNPPKSLKETKENETEESDPDCL
jgi:radical SAM protein with 4Fe4S-binding SPASM domain